MEMDQVSSSFVKVLYILNIFLDLQNMQVLNIKSLVNRIMQENGKVSEPLGMVRACGFVYI